jgi:hypothetical protein
MKMAKAQVLRNSLSTLSVAVVLTESLVNIEHTHLQDRTGKAIPFYYYLSRFCCGFFNYFCHQNSEKLVFNAITL